MAEDFDELRRFLRAEGIADRTALQEAEQDPRLAAASEAALALVLARQRNRRGWRLVGAAAVVGVGIAAASALFGGVLSPPASTPLQAEAAPAPLQFTAQPAPAGEALGVLTGAAEHDPVYAGSVPEPRSWYQWEASSSQNGELFVVSAQHGDRVQVQSFLVPPPQGGRIDVDASVRGPAHLASYGQSGAIAEGDIADVLISAAGADCTSGEARCSLEGLVALRASADPAAVVSDAAAWRTLATLPDVQATGLTTDRLGRSALGFTALESDTNQRILVLADPATGAFLGAEWTTAHGQVARMIVDTSDIL